MILVHGSGSQDRDASIGPNKPFRDLAWGLATTGIAVLRFEKRTRQYAARFAKITGDFTVQEETVADTLEAVSLLQKNKAVSADRIIVLGHSLGDVLIPRIGQSGSAAQTLNHLFMGVDGKSTGAKYQQPDNVAEAVVDDIVDWINRHP